MSKQSIWSIIFIILILCFVIWLYVQDQPKTLINQNPSTATVEPAPTVSTTVKDNSDAALSQDLSDVDNQLSGLNSDNAAVNQSATQ